MLEAVEFPSEGATLRGRFYRPAGTEPWPAVVMTHGTTATITMCLDRYAEVFCNAGIAVLLYDHRNFGLSDGEPRQLINPWLQARGYRDAMSYLLTRADIRTDKIAAWGDSYSGMIALAVGALDPRYAAVAVNVLPVASKSPSTNRTSGISRQCKQSSTAATSLARLKPRPGHFPSSRQINSARPRC